MIKKTKAYIHQILNQEVTAIGGSYVLTKEERLPLNHREVVYIVGYAIFDTTCCGSGGCNYANVPGFVINWKNKKNKDGIPISCVEPICDPTEQKKIRSLIEKKENVSQVNFY
jgi:hypothetical protein